MDSGDWGPVAESFDYVIVVESMLGKAWTNRYLGISMIQTPALVTSIEDAVGWNDLDNLERPIKTAKDLAKIRRKTYGEKTRVYVGERKLSYRLSRALANLDERDWTEPEKEV
jgi:hypothetical protein